ncbi:MAG TPA: hypothetical protein VLQ90_02820 [Pyrinomonadaceae bacterium]|nr:hypothetical protein [Pyrinomonadaceae bacterium]
MFVNAGTEPITRKDLAATTANRITFKPKPSATKLLSAACVAGDVGVCGAACVIVNENAEFTFEYLNPGHKIVVEVLYTGAMPDIHGQMVGGKIRTERHLQFHPIIEIFSLVGTYALAAAALLIPIGLFWLFQKLNVPFSRLLALITLVTFTVPAIIIGGPRLQRLTRAFTERREARTLEKYLVE